MRLTTALTILTVISVHTLAFSWRKHDTPKLSSADVEYPAFQDFALMEFGLDKDAIDSLHSHYKRKPDCFRRAAGRIRVRCAEMDMDADQRVKAAISMTLCELRTAGIHSIPLECELFLEEGKSSDRTPHGICVEALSRSTQSWASYSGYLREIPQLCSAYQRSNEIDLASEIYRNATIEKVAYIRHLMQRAEKEDEARTLWQSLLSDLQGSIDRLQATPVLADKIYVDISSRVLHELLQVMRAQKEVFDVKLQDSRKHSLVLSESSRTLMSLSAEFERSFSVRLNSGLQLLENRLSESLGTSDKMWQQISLIEGGLFSAMTSIAQLAASVHQLSNALNSSAHELELMNIAQANAVQATEGLTGNIKHMNETVLRALIDINATAVRVNQTISSYSFYSNFLSLAGATIIDWKHTSLGRLVASRAIRLLWFILQQSPSFLVMPCVVAMPVISVLRWFLRKVLLGIGIGHSRPCVCRLKPSSGSNQTSPSLTVPISSSVTLAARATPCSYSRRPLSRRSSQFSRIPDRLCGHRLDD